MIGIVDYGAGNIRSVRRAMEALGINCCTSKDPAELEKADRLIFPGVGDARFAMEQLRRTGLDTFLHDFVQSERPLLGICLGAQIIFSRSEEGDTECLGLLDGTIRHFDSLLSESTAENAGGTALKIPHMGWNDIAYRNGGDTLPLFKNVPDRTSFYFVHSYVIQPSDPSVITAAARYGIDVPAAVTKGNISAVQFHPEKSGVPGLRILKNFSESVSC